jgi:plasmid stability protein
MTTITVRNVPEDVRDELAARAARSGRSLQEYLASELARLAATPSAAEAVLRARLNARSYPELTADDVVTAVGQSRR